MPTCDTITPFYTGKSNDLFVRIDHGQLFTVFSWYKIAHVQNWDSDKYNLLGYFITLLLHASISCLDNSSPMIGSNQSCEGQTHKDNTPSLLKQYPIESLSLQPRSTFGHSVKWRFFQRHQILRNVSQNIKKLSMHLLTSSVDKPVIKNISNKICFPIEMVPGIKSTIVVIWLMAVFFSANEMLHVLVLNWSILIHCSCSFHCMQKNEVKYNVFEAADFCWWNNSIIWYLSLHHPVWLYLYLALLGHPFSIFKLLSLAKDSSWESSTRNTHMVHIVNWIQFKMVYTSKWKSRFIFQLLGDCHCWWTKEFPRAHVVKFYGRLRLIPSVLRASKFSMLKLTEIVVCFLHHPLWLYLYLSLLGNHFSIFKLLSLANDLWWGFSTRNTHLVHILLIASDSKWCIHLSWIFVSYYQLQIGPICVFRLQMQVISNARSAHLTN